MKELTDEPEYPEVGSRIPNRLTPGYEKLPGLSGYRVGECGHRVASQEWAAGFRVCERCPS